MNFRGNLLAGTNSSLRFDLNSKAQFYDRLISTERDGYFSELHQSPSATMELCINDSLGTHRSRRS
jgi:hypothetical protein